MQTYSEILQKRQMTSRAGVAIVIDVVCALESKHETAPIARGQLAVVPALVLVGCIRSTLWRWTTDGAPLLLSRSMPTAAPSAPAAPIDTAFCRGKANFHDRTLAGLGGNGRACSDCHMDSEKFPADSRGGAGTVQRDDHFRASTIRSFAPIDADDFRVNGAAAHDYTNLTRTVSFASPSRCPRT